MVPRSLARLCLPSVCWRSIVPGILQPTKKKKDRRGRPAPKDRRFRPAQKSSIQIPSVVLPLPGPGFRGRVGLVLAANQVRTDQKPVPNYPGRRPGHSRDLAETPAEVPNGMTVFIPLQPDSVPIRKSSHGSGEKFWFEVGAELVPWSWRQMLAGLGDRGKNAVGPGLRSITLYQRPGSYEHHRAHASTKHGGAVDVPPPI
jgi:hypothetical protein